LTWEAGEDPHNPQLEPHTGRTPKQAAGVAALSAIASAAAAESPVLQPIDAGEVNAALDAKRQELHRDTLTPEEYSEVLAKIQSKPRTAESEQEIRARIEKQHLALGALIGRGYTRNAALEVIGREGADKVLGISAGGGK
jgi:anti-sigma factor RsiW